MDAIETNDGGPAFPYLARGEVHGNRDGGHSMSFESSSGMSLRDWFAGQALSGLFALPDDHCCPNEIVKAGDEAIEKWREEMRGLDARDCYAYADAMLTARNQSKP